MRGHIRFEDRTDSDAKLFPLRRFDRLFAVAIERGRVFWIGVLQPLEKRPVDISRAVPIVRNADIELAAVRKREAVVIIAGLPAWSRKSFPPGFANSAAVVLETEAIYCPLASREEKGSRSGRSRCAGMPI